MGNRSQGVMQKVEGRLSWLEHVAREGDGKAAGRPRFKRW
jgi:hypothetical protein